MPIPIYTTSGQPGLFNVLGHSFNVIATLNADLLTQIPPLVLEILDSASLCTALPFQGMAAQLPSAQASQQATGPLVTAIASTCQTILASYVQNDGMNPTTLQANLAYLLNDMQNHTSVGADHVTSPTLSLTTNVTYMSGDYYLAITVNDNNGYACVNMLNEPTSNPNQQITITCTGLDSNSNPTFTCTSNAGISDRLNCNYNQVPYGSGLNATIPVTTATTGLLSNGNFASQSNGTNLPDNWIITQGLPGTNLFVTTPQVQTITISSTSPPTAGYWAIQWLDNNSIWRTTGLLNYAAASSTVQSALQAINGLGQVTVSSAGSIGTSITYSVTMTGVPYNPTAFNFVNAMTGGANVTITGAIQTAGDPNSYTGNSLKFVGNGSQIFELFSQLPTLQTSTTYLLTFRVRGSVGVSSGNLVVEMVTGVSAFPTVQPDPAGNNSGGANSLSIPISTISSSLNTPYTLAIRIPPSANFPLYLHVKTTTAPVGGATIYLDNFLLAAGTLLYNGGPTVAIAAGNASPATLGYWTIQTFVNRSSGGNVAYWCNRVFGLVDLGMVLPMSGSVGTVPESVIS
jgi:hypothetical protein